MFLEPVSRTWGGNYLHKLSRGDQFNELGSGVHNVDPTSRVCCGMPYFSRCCDESIHAHCGLFISCPWSVCMFLTNTWGTNHAHRVAGKNLQHRNQACTSHIMAQQMELGRCCYHKIMWYACTCSHLFWRRLIHSSTRSMVEHLRTGELCNHAWKILEWSLNFSPAPDVFCTSCCFDANVSANVANNTNRLRHACATSHISRNHHCSLGMSMILWQLTSCKVLFNDLPRRTQVWVLETIPVGISRSPHGPCVLHIWLINHNSDLI